MQVYANLLGSYVLLDNDKDMINGFRPNVFMEQHLHKYSEPFMFFTVIHESKKYQIPFDKFQSVEPIE